MGANHLLAHGSTACSESTDAQCSINSKSARCKKGGFWEGMWRLEIWERKKKFSPKSQSQLYSFAEKRCVLFSCFLTTFLWFVMDQCVRVKLNRSVSESRNTPSCLKSWTTISFCSYTFHLAHSFTRSYRSLHLLPTEYPSLFLGSVTVNPIWTRIQFQINSELLYRGLFM